MVHGPALPHLADPLMCGHQFPCSGLGWSWCYYFITGGNDIEPRRYWSLIDDRAANDPLVFTIMEEDQGISWLKLPPVQHNVQCLKSESTSRHFQLGEGPIRDLLCDCKTSHNLREWSFEALVLVPHHTQYCSLHNVLGGVQWCPGPDVKTVMSASHSATQHHNYQYSVIIIINTETALDCVKPHQNSKFKEVASPLRLARQIRATQHTTAHDLFCTIMYFCGEYCQMMNTNMLPHKESTTIIIIPGCLAFQGELGKDWALCLA